MSSFTWPLGRSGRPESTWPGRWPWSTRSGATAPADGYGADLGGPQVLDAAELARQVLAAMEVRRSVRRIRLPGRVAAGSRAGHHLAADTPRGKRTWASYLEARLAAGGGEVIGLPYINKKVRIRHR